MALFDVLDLVAAVAGGVGTVGAELILDTLVRGSNVKAQFGDGAEILAALVAVFSSQRAVSVQFVLP